MVRRWTESGRLARQDQLGGCSGASAKTVDQQPHRPRIEVTGAAVLEKLIDGAAGVERLRPVRPGRDQCGVGARNRDEVEPPQRRRSLRARVAEAGPSMVEEREVD